MGTLCAPSGCAATPVYDRIAGIYDATRRLPAWVADRVADHLRSRLSSPGQATVLEIGAGTGRIAAGFTRGEPLRQYVGLDLSPAMLAVLQAKLGDAVRPVLGDASRLPFASARFEAVLSCHVLQMVPDLGGAVAEIRRVLRPGGLYLHCTDELAPHQREYDQLWQTILTEEDSGYTPALRYDMRRDDVVDLWRKRGATVEATLVAQWHAVHRVGDLLAAYDAKAYPSCHRVAAPVLDAALARLRRETLRRYGDLGREFVSVTAMEIITARVSDPRR